MSKIFLFSFAFLLLTHSITWADPGSTPKEKKSYKLTILAFMNGYEKIIDPVVESLINQMEVVGSNEDVAIVAEWGSLQAGKTRRLFIEKDSDLNVIHSQILSESQANMGKAEELQDFLTWAAKEYPSEKVFVIIGGHGRGWPNVLYDARTNSKIPMPAFAAALKALSDLRNKKTDLLVFDACLMAGVEVASELSPYVNYMAAAFDKLPDDLWIPYDVAIGEIVNSSTTDPAIAGSIISRAYFESTKNLQHSDGILGIQFGVTNLQHMEKLESLASEVSEEILDLAPSDRKYLFSSLELNTQSFFIPYYRDMGEALEAIPRELRFERLRSAAQALRAEESSAVVYQAKTSYYPRTTGLSLSFIPEGKFGIAGWESLYSKLRWAEETGWDKVLSQLKRDRE